MIKLIKKNPILIIIVLALVLRFVQINQSLWLDEAIGAIVARDFSYKEIITNFIVVDNHTPGYYLLLKFWASLFGYSEVALRSLSILFGILTIYITYKIANEIGEKKTALIAPLLLATSQIHIYYSQEARMYSMVAFFASFAVLHFIKAVNRNKNINWILFSASTLLLIITDYMPVFLLPVFILYIFFTKRDLFIKVALSFVPLFIFGLIWFPNFVTQIKNYSIVPDNFLFGGATFKQVALVWMKFVFGRLSFEPKFLYYFLVGIASIPVIVAFFISRKRKQNLLIWLWLITPLALSFAVSFWFPAFSYFRFIYILPAFYILIALANKKILIYLVLISNFLSLGIYYLDENQQREQWRQAVAFIEEVESKNAIALFTFPEPFAPYRWYERGIVDAEGATDSISATRDKTKEKTNNLFKYKSKIYYFEYLREVSDPNKIVEQTIMENGFVETQKTSDFVGIGAITVYEKIK